MFAHCSPSQYTSPSYSGYADPYYCEPYSARSYAALQRQRELELVKRRQLAALQEQRVQQQLARERYLRQLELEELERERQERRAAAMHHHNAVHACSGEAVRDAYGRQVYDLYGRPLFHEAIEPVRVRAAPHHLRSPHPQHDQPALFQTRPEPVVPSRARQQSPVELRQPEPAHVRAVQTGPSQEQIQAALLIQNLFRQSRLVKSRTAQLDGVLAQFYELSSAFAFPDSAVFNNNGALAYASQNAGVLAYIEQLERLLLKVDGIESAGLRQVKQRRREAVRVVEKELARVEAWKAAQWQVQQQQAQQQSESTKPVVSATLPAIEPATLGVSIAIDEPIAAPAAPKLTSAEERHTTAEQPDLEAPTALGDFQLSPTADSESSDAASENSSVAPLVDAQHDGDTSDGLAAPGPAVEADATEKDGIARPTEATEARDQAHMEEEFVML